MTDIYIVKLATINCSATYLLRTLVSVSNKNLSLFSFYFVIFFTSFLGLTHVYFKESDLIVSFFHFNTTKRPPLQYSQTEQVIITG